MRRMICNIMAGAVLLLGLAGAAAAQDSASASPARSVLDGVYTLEQAAAGEAAFRDTCTACHGGSEFRGTPFQRNWIGRPVGELVELISTLMPLDSPGRLSRQTYVEIVAYFLKSNGYPAGDAPLPLAADSLNRIRMEPPASGTN